mmetsp:Transcript_2913/g.6649  ORF Transcript_2913/g.6649 Transcript_2913/m.6649 type:complete len:83 (+) Transcript_2913:66-314(+)
MNHPVLPQQTHVLVAPPTDPQPKAHTHRSASHGTLYLCLASPTHNLSLSHLSLICLSVSTLPPGWPPDVRHACRLLSRRWSV